jgi:hypothetical protein
VGGTFSPALANQLFLGNAIEAQGYRYCVLDWSGATQVDLAYYAFYTNNDELVWYWDEGLFSIPFVNYDNATLGPGATNMELGEMCPFRIVGHLGMIADPVPIHMTLDALAGKPISVPFLMCWLPPVVI